MINYMVGDLITSSKDNIHKFNPISLEEVRAMPSLVKFSSEVFKYKQEIKSFLRKSLYEHKQVKDMTNNAQYMIKTLFDYFKDEPKRIPKDFKKDTTDAFERTVSDYIAGMTDRFAIQIYNKIR
jgi:dGTPase